MSIFLHIIAFACIITITVCAVQFFKEKGKQAVISLLEKLIPVTGVAVMSIAFFWLLFLAPINIY